jgi:hypothetical protein
VDIVTPGNGALFLVPVGISICARTAYFTDTVASVEFFFGINVLGVVSNEPVLHGEPEFMPPYRPDFCFTWTNVPPGPTF